MGLALTPTPALASPGISARSVVLPAEHSVRGTLTSWIVTQTLAAYAEVKRVAGQRLEMCVHDISSKLG